MNVDLEPIPFVGWVQHSDDTVTQVKTEFDRGYEFGVKESAQRIAELEKAYAELNHKALALGLKNPQQTSAEPVACKG